jgi:uncharacterized iron-regulated protein
LIDSRVIVEVRHRLAFAFLLEGSSPSRYAAEALFMKSRQVLVLMAVMVLEACAAPAADVLRFKQPVVLLGELHDNAAQHALRVRAFEDWLRRGGRPALVMEQFDRERQGAIEALRLGPEPPTADALIGVAGGSGWEWKYYRPFIELALRHDLPIVAANVSRDDARQVISRGLEAAGFNPAVPADVLEAQTRSIEDGHCGTLDTATARRLALAQVARDQAMAAAIERHAARGVLLLAGNGHVRADIGVPRWLTAATRARSEAIGLLEEGSGSMGAFDRVLRTAAAAREDPCAQLRAPRIR